ncbi:unnamed protein product [Ilex paraguariensis]|uniref:Phosphofructokinase domain-containing protein n=1 Tax=Ilex paraguariensis TaxID=185542 RepID=A0ABC8U9Z2_9AQUA
MEENSTSPKQLWSSPLKILEYSEKRTTIYPEENQSLQAAARIKCPGSYCCPGSNQNPFLPLSLLPRGPNKFKQAEEIALKLDLDGIVVIGGDDSNTNACLLAENFRVKM